MPPRRPVKRVCLAYSGGLDTSVILHWLIENLGCEVVAYTADVGQEEELSGLPEKARATGAVDCVVRDLREEFVRDFVYPAIRGAAVYEGSYLLGTALARPLIAKEQVQVALETGCDAVAHGATGKGNDQVRFELAFRALAPELAVIAPVASARAPSASPAPEIHAPRPASRKGRRAVRSATAISRTAARAKAVAGACGSGRRGAGASGTGPASMVTTS